MKKGSVIIKDKQLPAEKILKPRRAAAVCTHAREPAHPPKRAT